MPTQTPLAVLHGRPDPTLRALARGNWKERGTCRQTDPELWFADSNRRVKARAATICSSCPVRRQCLAWALAFDEEYGIWGGLDASQLRSLRRRLTYGESLRSVVFDVVASVPASTSAGGAVA